MVKRSALAAACLALVLAAPTQAHESTRRFSDPAGDGQADIVRTSKATIHKAPHHHRTKFAVRLRHAGFWHVDVFVDSRGGPRSDLRLESTRDLGLLECSGRRRGGGEISLSCGNRRLNDGSEKLWWSIRRSILDPTKRIRWRVVSDTPQDPVPGVPEVDRAPDVGWFK